LYTRYDGDGNKLTSEVMLLETKEGKDWPAEMKKVLMNRYELRKTTFDRGIRYQDIIESGQPLEIEFELTDLKDKEYAVRLPLPVLEWDSVAVSSTEGIQFNLTGSFLGAGEELQVFLDPGKGNLVQATLKGPLASSAIHFPISGLTGLKKGEYKCYIARRKSLKVEKEKAVFDCTIEHYTHTFKVVSS
jgi:hypothetical protein